MTAPVMLTGACAAAGATASAHAAMAGSARERIMSDSSSLSGRGGGEAALRAGARGPFRPRSGYEQGLPGRT